MVNQDMYLILVYLLYSLLSSHFLTRNTNEELKLRRLRVMVSSCRHDDQDICSCRVILVHLMFSICLSIK